MEQLDDMLRSIPDVDRFKCVERIMCSLAAGQQTPSAPETPLGQFPGFDPTFQQGLILDPSTIQQSFSGLAQNPGLQQGLQSFVQNPGLQQGLQSFVQNPGLQQGLQGLVQNPGFQQGLQGFIQNPSLQQGLQGLVQSPALQQGIQGLQQAFPSFQSQAFQSQPITGLQGSSSQFLGGSSFQNIPLFRENPDVSGRNAASDTSRVSTTPLITPPGKPRVPPRRLSVPPPPWARNAAPQRGPPLRRQSQRRGFLGFGRRKKRDIFEDLLSSLSPTRMLGLLDQMMTRYSFYPYTHAAYMGLSGSPESCEQLYSECPSTAEEMIDLFNNIHKHYPNGIPFKENLPWPLNVLLP